MKMSDYAGTKFIGLADVAEGPMRATIAEIALGDYEKPVATFTNGSKFSLNKTNVRTLLDAYGDDGRDWAGYEIELREDETTVKGKLQPFIRAIPISSARPAAPGTTPAAPPAAKKSSDMDDVIPF
jgi:hypothetical protein